ncbi:GNAT family N-acetyltransferase, partial [Pseudomonas sp. HMWF005]
MPNLNDLTALALPSGRHLAADATESRLSLSLDGQPLIRLRLERDGKGPIQLDERYALPVG